MRSAFPVRPLATAFILLLGLAACTNGPDRTTTASPAGPPLYEKLGGKPALTAVVDDFVATVGSDSRIAARFANIDAPRFKAGLVEQLCTSTGGPCHYAGPSMKDAHAALGISDAEFNAMIQDLRRSMDRQGISVENQVAFAAAVEPLRDAVVSPLRPTTTVVTIPAGRAPSDHVGHGRWTASRARPGVRKATTHHPLTKHHPVTTHHPAASHHPTAATKKVPPATNH